MSIPGDIGFCWQNPISPGEQNNGNAIFCRRKKHSAIITIAKAD